MENDSAFRYFVLASARFNRERAGEYCCSNSRAKVTGEVFLAFAPQSQLKGRCSSVRNLGRSFLSTSPTDEPGGSESNQSDDRYTER
jgi:hypothetical protein